MMKNVVSCGMSLQSSSFTVREKEIDTTNAILDAIMTAVSRLCLSATSLSLTHTHTQSFLLLIVTKLIVACVDD